MQWESDAKGNCLSPSPGVVRVLVQVYRPYELQKLSFCTLLDEIKTSYNVHIHMIFPGPSIGQGCTPLCHSGRNRLLQKGTQPSRLENRPFLKALAADLDSD